MKMGEIMKRYPRCHYNCEGGRFHAKKAFPTLEAAAAHQGSHCHAYLCKVCGAYHIGHPKGTKGVRKQSPELAAFTGKLVYRKF